MSELNNIINDRKPRIILIEYITINDENYRIILMNFNVSKSTQEKIICNYGLNNVIPFNDMNKKHIKLTLIPMKDNKVSNIQIIWQGKKEKNDMKFITVDQMVYKYNQLDTINIPKIISRSRKNKKLNNQSEILSISSDDLDLFSTPRIDECRFINDLMMGSDDDGLMMESGDNEDNNHNKLVQISEDRKILEDNKQRERDRINSIFSKVMKEIVKIVPLRRVITNKRTESIHWSNHELDLLRYHNLMKYSFNMLTNLLYKPDVRTLITQKNKLIHKYSQHNLNYDMKVVKEECQVIKRTHTWNRRPMFYDNQILGLFISTNYNKLYSMKRYIIKHIESTSDKPEYCFICDVKLIRELFRNFKRYNPLNYLKNIYQFREYDYKKYRNELEEREMMRKVKFKRKLD
jgi:hypothetical protein